MAEAEATGQTVGETTLIGCIAVKDAHIRDLEKVLRDTKSEIARQRAARRELQAKLSGVAIGDVVTWRKGNKTFRGRVERFTVPRWHDYADRPAPLALDVTRLRGDREVGGSEIVETWTVER